MRRVLVFCLLALLLSLQHEAQVHVFSHFAVQPARSDDTGQASNLAGAECEKCALLAGAARAIPASQPALFAMAPAGGDERSIFRSQAVAAPVYFSSQAPPTLS